MGDAKPKTAATVDILASATTLLALYNTKLGTSFSKAKSDMVQVKAASTNAANITIGDSTVTAGNGLNIEPGQGFSLPFIRLDGGNVTDLKDWYAIGTVGDKLDILPITAVFDTYE